MKRLLLTWITLILIGLISSSCTTRARTKVTIDKPNFSLSYLQSSYQKGFVLFTARLQNPEALDCAAIEWHFGDGSAEQIRDYSCPILPKIWTKEHIYRYYGTFEPVIYLRSQVNGSTLEQAKARVVFVGPSE